MAEKSRNNLVVHGSVILQHEKARERFEKILIIVFFSVGCTLSFLFGEFMFNGYYSKVEENNDEVLGVSAQEDKTVFSATQKPEVIFYQKKGNLWIHQIQSKRDIQLTADADGSMAYMAPAWKNATQVSFARCGKGSCLIQVYDTKQQKTVDSFMVAADSIVSLQWAHLTSTVGYIYEKNGVTHGAVYDDSGKETILYTYEHTENRLPDLTDSLTVSFSSDDSHFFFANTLITEGKSIIVFDREYKEVIGYEFSKEVVLTHPFFLNNDELGYRKGEQIYVKALRGGDEYVLSDRINGALHPQLSVDGQRITYWTYDWHRGTSTVWLYHIRTGEIKRLVDGKMLPIWFDSNTLIAVKNDACIQCSLQKFSLSSIDMYAIDKRKESIRIPIETPVYVPAPNY